MMDSSSPSLTCLPLRDNPVLKTLHLHFLPCAIANDICVFIRLLADAIRGYILNTELAHVSSTKRMDQYDEQNVSTTKSNLHILRVPMIAKNWYNESEWELISRGCQPHFRNGTTAFDLLAWCTPVWTESCLFWMSCATVNGIDVTQMRILILGHLQNTLRVMRTKLIVIVFLNWWVNVAGSINVHGCPLFVL